MNNQNDACKVTATSVGILADCSFENVSLFDHLTPQIRQLPVDAKKFQIGMATNFGGQRIVSFICIKPKILVQFC